jgi:hypothetical protein
VVLANSRRLSRFRRYLGTPSRDQCLSRTGLLPTVARRSKTLPLDIDFVTLCRIWCSDSQVPRPPTGNATRLYHQLGLGYSRFARRYSGSRNCFLFLGVLRCFNSPGSLHWSYVFRPGSHPITGAGFPHSDIHGSKLDRQLPVAYRSHPRPSSASGAKASTVGSL